MKKFVTILLIVTSISLNCKAQEWFQIFTGVTADLNSISFINDTTGIAVGTTGTILLTYDGGQNWNQVTLNFDKSLNHVCHINDSVLIAVGDSAAVFKSVDAGLSWQKKVIRDLSADLYGVDITPSGKGIAVGMDETILWTSNYGDNWQIKRTGYWGVNFNIQMLNDSTGYIFGTNAIPEPLVTYSFDGFSTMMFRDFYPFYHNSSYLGYLYDGFIIDSLHGVFTGTTEFGQGFITIEPNWNIQQWDAVLYPQQLYTISRKDSLFIAGGVNSNGEAFLCESVNSGNTWTAFTFDGIYSVINDIGFADNCVYATGTDGVILKKIFNTSFAPRVQVNKINVFPNPATGYFIIDLGCNPNNEVELSITDACGKVAGTYLVKNKTGISKYYIETSGLNKGLYLIQVKSNNNCQVTKVMVSK